MDPPALLQALMTRDGVNSHSLAGLVKGKPSQPQIYKFLKGVAKEPRRPTLAPLAAHFGIPLDAFYDPDVAEQVAAERGLLPASEPNVPTDEAETFAPPRPPTIDEAVGHGSV